MAGMQMVTAATMGGALIFGMALALLGRLKLAVARREPESFGQPIRHWLLALQIALIPLVLLSGVLLDVFGARAVLVAGSVMLSVGLVALSLRPTSRNTLAAVLLAGFGASGLGTASTVLMTRAFFAAEETAAALNLGYVFIALGALLTPVLTDILLDRIELRRTLAAFALLSLTPAFLAVLPSGEHKAFVEPHGNPAASFADPACWLAALVLFFYVPLEASISWWTFTLLCERKQDERAATGLLYGFWSAFLASRLLAAVLQHISSFSASFWERALIVLLPLLAAVLLGNLAGADPRGRLRAGLILLGLLLGPILPTLLGAIFRAAPDVKGTSYGLAFAGGSLGSLVLAHLVAPLSAGRHPLSALRLPIFLALLATAAALVLGLIMP